jgi:hypothetical protein
MALLGLIKFWRESAIIALLIIIGGLLISGAHKDKLIAQGERDKMQLQLVVDAIKQKTDEAIVQQKKRDSAAEKAALIHQKKLDAINTESVPEQCEQGKDWAILKAIDFREDR